MANHLAHAIFLYLTLKLPSASESYRLRTHILIQCINALKDPKSNLSISWRFLATAYSIKTDQRQELPDIELHSLTQDVHWIINLTGKKKICAFFLCAGFCRTGG
jgi:hypothetical protein